MAAPGSRVYFDHMIPLCWEKMWLLVGLSFLLNTPGRKEAAMESSSRSLNEQDQNNELVSLPTKDGCIQHNRLLPRAARSAKGITGLYQGFLPFLTIPLGSRQHFCCGTFSKNVTKQQFLSTLPQNTLALDFVLSKNIIPSLSSRNGAGKSRADGWIQLKRSSCSQKEESCLLNGEGWAATLRLKSSCIPRNLKKKATVKSAAPLIIPSCYCLRCLCGEVAGDSSMSDVTFWARRPVSARSLNQISQEYSSEPLTVRPRLLFTKTKADATRNHK